MLLAGDSPSQSNTLFIVHVRYGAGYGKLAMTESMRVESDNFFDKFSQAAGGRFRAARTTLMCFLGKSDYGIVKLF